MLLYLITILLNSTTFSNHCDMSPNGQYTCVPLWQCEYINEIVSLSTNHLQNRRLAFKLDNSTSNISYCGFDLMGPKVCCPQNESVLRPQISNIEPTSQAPPMSQAPNQITTTVHDDDNKISNFFPKSCGEIDDTFKIFDGYNAKILEFPWMVILYYNESNRINFFCGGTIINERYILTAAHCLTQLPPRKKLTVRVGEYNLKTDPDCYSFDNRSCAPRHQDIEIDRTMLHPYFNRITFRNDIGLIRLARPLNFSVSNNIAAMCLPRSAAFMEKKIENTSFKIIGWGLSNEDNRNDLLQQADIPYVAINECRKIFKENNNSFNLTSGHICAGRNKNRPCMGDSGGPLINSEDIDGVQRYVQHGIVSFGPRTCGSNRSMPVVFTRVSYYMKWIIRQFQKYK